MTDGCTTGQRAAIQAAFAEFPEVERVVLFDTLGRTTHPWTHVARRGSEFYRKGDLPS